MNWFSKIWNDERRLTPARAVLHPAWIVAVAVLLINDHVLKPSAFAGPLTGKLSDFAGLFFVPVLFAALIGVKRRRGLWLAAVAVGGVFAAINLSPVLAGMWDAMVSMVVPFHTTPDPTDLVALLAIPAGLWLFTPLMHSARAGSTRRLVEYAAVTVGALASIATSPHPCDGPGCEGIVEQQSQVSILNKTNELHVLRLRSLRASIELDCEEVSRSPNDFLKDAAFGTPETWLVQSGQEIPIVPVTLDEFGGATPRVGEECQAVLVQSDTVPDILVFWRDSLPMKSFQFDADVPPDIPADPQTVVLDADYSRARPDQMHPWRNRGDCGERADLCGDALLEPLAEIPEGARYSWRSEHDERLHFVRPNVQSGPIEEIATACMMPGPGDGLAWERPPRGDHVVVGIEPGIDGCHEVRLTGLGDVEPMEEEVERGWWLCVPFDSLSFLAPTETTRTRIAVSTQDTAATFQRGGFEGLRIDATRTPVDAETPGGLEFRKIYAVKGYGLPQDVDFGFGVTVREGCGPQEVACGQTAMPIDVVLTEYGEQVSPGESIAVGEVVPLEVYVARAEYRPVLDRECEAEDGAGDERIPSQGVTGYLEAMIVAR